MTRRFADVSRPLDPWTWQDTFYSGLLAGVFSLISAVVVVGIFLVKF